MDKPSVYRLGVSLLAVTLAFIGAQILDWAPDVNAQVTAASSAELAWLPNPHPARAPAGIVTWGTTISAPGTYTLINDLLGTTGTAIIIAANDVTILGNGKTIRGDGNFSESSNTETGISIGNNSNVQIVGVHFAQLDKAISVENTGPVQDNSVRNAEVDTVGYGVYWMNQSTALNISFQSNIFNYARNSGVYWYNPNIASRSDGVWITNSRFQNTGKSGGSGAGVYLSNHGSAQNTYISNDTFIGNKRDVVAYSYSDSTKGLNVSNNYFQNSGQNIYVVNYGGIGKGIIGATVSGNKFLDNVYPYTPYPQMPAGHINFYNGGNGFQITNNNISGGTNMSGIRIAGYYLEPDAPAPQPFYNLVIRYNTCQNLAGDDGTGKAACVHFFNMADTWASGSPGRFSPQAVLTSAQPTVRDNAFINTSGPGISYTKGVSNPLATIIAQYNYWGSPDGPNGAGGTGVSGNVDYSNWLTAPPPTNFLNLPLILR